MGLASATEGLEVGGCGIASMQQCDRAPKHKCAHVMQN